MSNVKDSQVVQSFCCCWQTVKAYKSVQVLDLSHLK